MIRAARKEYGYIGTENKETGRIESEIEPKNTT